MCVLLVAAEVVVDLILDMKGLGHPSFVALDPDQVRQRASQLPIDGVPPEVLDVIQEDLGRDDAPLESALQPQKAATPCDAPVLDAEAAGEAFASQRPRAVVAEGRSKRDAHEAERCALDTLMTDLHPDSAPQPLRTVEIRAGNRLLDMFRPCYWSIAFCFLFKHATAEPDVTNTARPEQDLQVSRRQQGNRNAPEVGIRDWAAAMQRQVCSQFRRDWNFSPALWNYLFRTMINLEPNSTMYAAPQEDATGRRVLTVLQSAEIQKGVQEIYTALQRGTYVDVNGDKKAVNGDLSKLRHVPDLTDAARKVLSNVEARTRRVAGTHEVRSTMRHQTHAYRVNYGLALFITFSPSERDSSIMVRMARARQTDPAIVAEGANSAFYRRDKPQLDVEYCCLSAERLAEVGKPLTVTRRWFHS